MQRKLKCILIDDEKEALDGLEILLLNNGNVDIIAKIQNPVDAVQNIMKLKPEVVFLDIDMPLKNGFEVLEDIKIQEINTKVVFVTAFNQYILKALRNSAFDYLTKPVDRLELKGVVGRLLKKEKHNYSENISLLSLNMLKIQNNYGSIFIKKNDIIYIEADGNYSKIHTTEGLEMSSKNLGKFEQILINDNFVKISKSLIINILYLTKFNKKKKTCYLTTKEKTYELTVSRRKLNIFENLL